MGVKHAAFLLVLMALSVKLNDGNYMCVQKTCYNGHKPNCLMRQNGSLLHQCNSTSTAPETPQALVQS
ncbi:uncharacterized protein LOC142587854 isoform X3 [Dermacentor variabilis]|uniref:uncharacterized protein LOC142587854 isoform X3 n=1 Tax=Dermacentor variabilis TaxID=34621 RepID=UPI003F5CBC3D